MCLGRHLLLGLFLSLSFLSYDGATEAPCCTTLTVSSTGLAKKLQASSLGTYHIDGKSKGKISYIHENKRRYLYYLYYRTKGYWRISGVKGSQQYNIYSKCNQACPTKCTSWNAHETSNQFTVDPSFTLKCDDQQIDIAIKYEKGQDVYCMPQQTHEYRTFNKAKAACSMHPKCKMFTDNQGKANSFKLCNGDKVTRLSSNHGSITYLKGCLCKDFINSKGHGNCKTASTEHGRNTCYVVQPSGCSDLVESKLSSGEKFSAEACDGRAHCFDKGIENVTNRQSMMNYWKINVDSNNDDKYDTMCGTNTFWGYANDNTIGWISTVLMSSGRATLNFGNCYRKGKTKVFLNNKEIGTAESNQLNVQIEFAYNVGDTLKIEEHNTGILRINSIKTECTDETTTPRSLSTKSDGTQSHNSNGTGDTGNENRNLTSVWIGIGCGGGILLISAIVTFILIKTKKNKSVSNKDPNTDADYDDGNMYDSVDPGDTNTRLNRIGANNPPANIIENPYYGGEDDVMNTVNASNTNVQRQDQGFTSVTVVDNLYYQ